MNGLLVGLDVGTALLKRTADFFSLCDEMGTRAKTESDTFIRRFYVTFLKMDDFI